MNAHEIVKEARELVALWCTDPGEAVARVVAQPYPEDVAAVAAAVARELVIQASPGETSKAAGAWAGRLLLEAQAAEELRPGPA